MFKIDANHTIDATFKGGIARFINHSCDPNCSAKVIWHDSSRHIVLFANRQ